MTIAVRVSGRLLKNCEYVLQLSQLLERHEGESTMKYICITGATRGIGPLRVTHALLALLQAGNEKILLNISSEAGSIGNSFRTSWYAYCMSKAALNMQSAMLRDHLQEDDIKVIIMHPGWVQTFMRGKVDSDATYTPKEAAQMIYNTMRRQAAEPFSRNNFIDSEGRQLPW